MIKHIIIILILSASGLLSQGFDWQLSSRKPFDITNKYIGVTGSIAYGSHSGDFPFLENDVVCCNYESGSGTGVQIGLAGEYWYQNNIAFSSALLYTRIASKFSTETSVIKKTNPDLPGFNWVTAYESDISLDYITLDLAVKQRIYDKLNLKAGIDFNYNIGSSELHKNIVVEPANIPFSDGTFEKVLTNGRIGDLSKMVLGVSLGLSYDINLGIEKYGEISILSNYSVNSYISNYPWYNLQAKLSARAFLGVK